MWRAAPREGAFHSCARIIKSVRLGFHLDENRVKNRLRTDAQKARENSEIQIYPDCNQIEALWVLTKYLRRFRDFPA